MKRIAIAALVMIGGSAVSAPAAQPLSAERAANKAVSILQGDPYGNTKSEVLKGISEQVLVVKGINPCTDTPVKSPIWVFRVKATSPNGTEANGEPSMIEGFLALDGSSGEMACAGLPYLD